MFDRGSCQRFSFGLRVVLMALGMSTIASSASAFVIDFDAPGIKPGQIIDSVDTPAGPVTIEVQNCRVPLSSHPNKWIVFDSECGCTGEDPDLKTPVAGVVQGVDNTHHHNIMIVAEDIFDRILPKDGLVDDPDDEAHGGTIVLRFPKPLRVDSLDVFDIDVNEITGFIELGGAVSPPSCQRTGNPVFKPIPALGNNSAQKITFDDLPGGAPVVESLTIHLHGSGAVDDIVLTDVQGGSTTTTTGSSTTTSLIGGGTTTTTGGATTTTTGGETTTTFEGGTTTTTGGVTTTTGGTTTTSLIGGGTTTTTGGATTTSLIGGGTTTTTGGATTTTTGGGTTTTTGGATTTTTGGGTTTTTGGGETTTTGGITTTSLIGGGTTTTTPSGGFCGDGIVQPPEVCEPSLTVGCSASCQLEECPTQTEICGNGLDDDEDGFIDCFDTDCEKNSAPPCGCEGLLRDPGLILFDTKKGADYFSLHGNFKVHTPVSFDTERFGVILANDAGTIWRGTLAPGDLHRRVGGKGRYMFRDRLAYAGGPGDADNFYMVGLRLRPHGDEVHCHFRVKAYGDFSAATDAKMSIQLAVGDDSAGTTQIWTQTHRGWVLHLRDFDSDQ